MNKIRNIKHISIEEIDKFAKSLDFVLHEQYRKFLLEYNGGVPSLNYYLYSPGKGILIRSFLGLNNGSTYNLEHTLSIYRGRIPNLYMPIANVESGNLLLMSMNDGGIYFWDHELELNREYKPEFVAKNIDLLIAGLETYKLDEEPEVVSSWIDPDFKPEFD